jgi:nucleoside-triphosphatase
MHNTFLITGKPGCGKTTLIQQVLGQYKGAVGGFYTREIRDNGVRKGFELVTLDGKCGVLAHMELKSQRRVGKYGVDLAVLETLAVQSILGAMKQKALVVIDEIGPMEMLSEIFCRVVMQALDGGGRVLGAIVQRGAMPFSDAVKRRKDVRVVTLNEGNRDKVMEQALAWLQN